jgi:hypothetical protein
LQILLHRCLTGDEFDAAQMRLFAAIDRIRSHVPGSRWRLKFTIDKQNPLLADILRTNADYTSLDQAITARLNADGDVALLGTATATKWSPANAYLESSQQFTPEQIEADLNIAHVWSSGFATFFRQLNGDFARVRSLHPEIQLYLLRGRDHRFRSKLNAYSFPEADIFVSALHPLMESASSFADSGAPSPTVPWARRHLRRNTVFCPDSCAPAV